MSDTIEQAKDAQQRHLVHLRQRVSNLYAEWSELREYEAGLKYLEAEEALDQLIAAVRAEAQREAFEALLADAERDLAAYVKETGNVHPTRSDGDLFAFIRELKRRIKPQEKR